MKRWMKVVTILFTSAILTFSLAACGKKDSSTNIKKVRLAEVTRSVFYAPQYVAIAKGYFKDEGLDVQLKTTAGGDKTMTALLSNSTDIALVGAETSIYVYAQGTDDPVINFAQLTDSDGTFLVSRKKIDNFSWDQLKGTTFLGQRKGGMPQVVSEFVLNKEGINPQKDLKLIQNIDFANIANAFASGTGDFVQLFEPTATIMEKEHKGYIVASFGEASGSIPYTDYMAKQSYLKENKDTIKKFTKALLKAQKYVASTDPTVIAKDISSFFENTDVNDLATSIKRYRNQGSYKQDMILSKASWSHLQDIMDASGVLPKRVNYDTLVDTSFTK